MKGDTDKETDRESQIQKPLRQEESLKQNQEKKKRQQELQKQGPLNQAQTEDSQRQPKEQKQIQVPVKTAKPEKLDREIEEIAKKIKEANEKKMVQLRSHPMLPNTQSVETRPPTEILSEDWTSIQGQFGWTELGNNIIPYLTRSGRKYVALRMADNKIFFKYRQLFTDEIRNCFQIEKINVTNAEAELLNEINFRHCDNFFGRLAFTVSDGIVTLNDINEMHEFLDFCYVKLAQKNTTPHKRCGFIRIASQNCVPYVWYDEKQYVPLFYFEGECKYLEERSVELRDWELAYLKLSCKIQGIRKALFDNESIRVVELELVKKFFPPGTLFEETWPIECNVESLIQKSVVRIVPMQTVENESVQNVQESSANKKVRCYERQPQLQKKPMPVKSGMPVAQPPTANSSINYNKSLKPLHLSQNKSANSHVSNRQNTYQDHYLSSLTTTAPVVLNNAYSTANTSSNIVANGPSIATSQGPTTTYTTKSTCPASTVPNNAIAYKQTTKSTCPASTVPNNAIAYKQTTKSTCPATTVPNNAIAYKQTPVLRAISTPNCSGSKILQIPDFLCSNNGFPYFQVRTLVEDKQLNCINMEPYFTTNLLIPLEEIAMVFFGLTMNLVVNAVNVMRLDIFMPNKLQIRSLERAKMYPTGGLIKLKDFVDNLPQIRYILTSD